MAASVHDSEIYGGLFGDAEAGQLFTDSAELRAMLMVEGALAKVQGEVGMIPADAATWLYRACQEVTIDPASLTAETAVNGVPVPALVAAFRKTAGSPQHAQYLHWGATSQDIMDSGLMLRLKQLLELFEGRLEAVLAALADQARAHAARPMAGRTFGQTAAPTSFGAVVASWGRPLLRLRQRLAEMRPRLLAVQLGGAAGTLSVLGEQGPAIRAGLAVALGLADPGASWHSERDRIAELAGWMMALTAALGKMGEDLHLMAQSGIEEITFAGGGASSTMPQKSNPIMASAVVALARHAAGLNMTLQSAALHRQNRDGAAWFTEWLTLPQLCLVTARALDLGRALGRAMTPDAAAMAAAVDDELGLIHAEAIAFALALVMPRPEAQSKVKSLCQQAKSTKRSVVKLVADTWPEIDWKNVLSLETQIGTAKADAMKFAEAVKAATV